MGPLRTLALALALGACGTVDLGDNFVAPNLRLDEDFFYCRIQPEVISAQSCASGGAGEMGSCHTARSALRLNADAERVPAPMCDDDRVIGVVPLEYEANLTAVRFTIQSDPQSSPFFTRPTGQASHPRTIFDPASPEAQLIIEWIARGGG